MAAPRLLLLPAAPISPVQGGLLFHGGEEGDAEMAVKGQIDDDIPGRVDVTALSADVLDHRSGCPSTGWTDAQCFSRWFYRRLIIPQDLIMQSASYAKYQTVSKRELISGFPPSISCTKYKNSGCPGKAQGSRYFFNAQCQTVPGRPPYKNSAENFWTNLRSGFPHLPTGCNERLIIKAHDLMRGRRPSLFHHRS